MYEYDVGCCTILNKQYKDIQTFIVSLERGLNEYIASICLHSIIKYDRTILK